MIKPSFIPSPETRQFCDLIRYNSKFTNMLFGEKNHTPNCLTVPTIMPDDVFSDIFEKPSHSITHYIFGFPSMTFDVALFVNKRCKSLIDEMPVAVDGFRHHQLYGCLPLPHGCHICKSFRVIFGFFVILR